jgi:hypothetical protein
MTPQMVVPVFMVLMGWDIWELAAMAVFLMQLSKLKPPSGSALMYDSSIIPFCL